MTTFDPWAALDAGVVRGEADLVLEAMTTGLSYEAMFREEPVPLTTFIQDKAYMGNPPLSALQYDAVLHAERIYLPQTYELLAEADPFWAQPVRMTNLLTLQWGKGGGKDHICRMATLRIAYLLLCLKSPQTYYGMPSDDTIHMLNIASNSAQGLNAFFKPMTKSVMRGWFKDRAVPRMDSIVFENGVESISGHSDAESQEGLNLILGIADEIDAFKTNSEIERYRGKSVRESSRSSQTVLDMIRTSASTRFPEVYKNIRISYPRYLGSTIQVLTDQAKAAVAADPLTSRHYVSGPYCTWDVNPRVNGPEQFADDYADDPAMAAAKYECRPTRAVDTYFKEMDVFRKAVVADTQPLEVKYVRRSHATLGGDVQEAWDVDFVFAPEFQPISGALYAVHADLAVKGDRAGIGMSHVLRYDVEHLIAESEFGEVSEIESLKPVVHNDFCISLESSVIAPAREIQIRWVRKLALELFRRGFVLGSFSYDGFQSVDSLQILDSWGIPCNKVSADRTDTVWKTLRDVAYDARLSMPFSALLLIELESLGRSGNKVDHPIGGCFVGDTRIPLLDGSFPMISELDGQEVWVYSATHEGKIVPGRARGRKTKETTELVDVVLDSGYVARCTPEHLWMLRDGSYAEAQTLRPGVTRLMPVSWTWPVNGGYTRATDKDGVRTLVHHLVLEHLSGRQRAGHEIVHHLDEVKTNNHPANLEFMTQLDHVTHHGSDRWDAKRAAMAAGHEAWRASDRFVGDLAKREFRTPFDGLAPAERSARYQELHPLDVHYRADVTMEHVAKVAADGARNANEAARLLNCGRNVVVARLRAAGYDSFGQLLVERDNNHKVRAVIPVHLDVPVPVYDLEVDEFSNFALSGGVFVHNSKDLADTLACSVAQAIVIGGEEDETGAINYASDFDFGVGPPLELMGLPESFGASVF